MYDTSPISSSLDQTMTGMKSNSDLENDLLQ